MDIKHITSSTPKTCIVDSRELLKLVKAKKEILFNELQAEHDNIIIDDEKLYEITKELSETLNTIIELKELTKNL